MNVSELRNDPAQKRRAMWALGVVLVLGVVAIGVVSRADRGRGGLPKLPIGAGSGAATMERSAAADAMIAPWGGIEYRLAGTLPELDRSATAFRIESATRADAERIARAFGMQGDVKESAEEYVVVDGKKELHVQRQYGSPWWFNDMGAQEQANGSVSSGGSSGTASTTSCACPEGAACDCPAPDTVPCEMPPCPDGTACIQSCPQPSPHVPQRPADLPTQDEAREIAREVFSALGVAAGELRVDDGYTAWYVNAPTVVGGVDVEGMTTSVGVGPKGVVVSANGRAGRIVAVADYPLVSVAEGFERLKSGFPHSGPDCIDCTRPLATGDAATTPAPDPDAPVSSGDSSGPSSAGGGSSAPSSGGDDARCAADGPGCMEPTPAPYPCDTVSSVPPDDAARREMEARKAAEAESGGGSSGSTGSAGATEPAVGQTDPAAGCAQPEPYPMPEPEPQVVTITGARLGLVTFGEYLVPAFVFESANGSFPVVAVEKQHLASVTPDPEGQGRPEPAVQPENGNLVVD